MLSIRNIWIEDLNVSNNFVHEKLEIIEFYYYYFRKIQNRINYDGPKIVQVFECY